MKQKSQAVLALLGSIGLAYGQEEWVQYYICDIADTSSTLAIDSKDITADPQDLGLIEPTDCIDYCQEQKTALSVTDVSCCTHARYYYTESGIWAADCSLNAATSLVALEDTWNEPLGEYATFQAVVLEADASGGLVGADYSSSTGELGQPADWKISETWRDGYYCDVETTDYEYIAEPDSYWNGLQSREACLEFCYRNMEEYGATCCGQAWLYQYATDLTQAYCALYISKGFRLMSVEETSTYVLFYSSIELSTDVQQNLDNISGTIEDYLKDIAGDFGTEDIDLLSGDALNLDAIELGEVSIDFGDNANAFGLSLATVSSIVMMMLS